MIWEYKVVYFGLDAVSPQVIEEDEYEERLYNGAEMLNEMGREGWELVAFLSHTTASNLNKYHAVLKRAKDT